MGCNMKAIISIAVNRVAWSVSEVAASTGLSRGFVRGEIKRGHFRTRRAGRRGLVLDKELHRYLNDDAPQ